MREELINGPLPFLKARRHDHLAQFKKRLFRPFAVEHVLCPEQPDAFGPELPGFPGIIGRIGIGTDIQRPDGIADLQEIIEDLIFRRSIHHLQLPLIHETLGSVERDPLPLVQDQAAFHINFFLGQVDLQGGATHDTALAPAAGHKGCVRCHAPSGSQDGLCGAHPVDVLRVRFFTDQDDLLAFFGQTDGICRRKDDHAASGARPGRKPFGNGLFRLLFGRIDDRMQEFIKLFRRDTADRRRFIDKFLFHHVGRDLHGCRTISFSDTALQHEQSAFFNGELDILHVMVMFFEPFLDIKKFFVNLGHLALQGLQVFIVLALGILVDGRRGTDACDDILALGIDQILAVKCRIAVTRIAREGHARRRIIAHVAENHGLDVDGRSPFMRDMLDIPVSHGALAVP